MAGFLVVVSFRLVLITRRKVNWNNEGDVVPRGEDWMEEETGKKKKKGTKVGQMYRSAGNGPPVHLLLSETINSCLVHCPRVWFGWQMT